MRFEYLELFGFKKRPRSLATLSYEASRTWALARTASQADLEEQVCHHFIHRLFRTDSRKQGRNFRFWDPVSGNLVGGSSPYGC